MMGLFGKTRKDPKETVREMERKLRQETRLLDRQIANIQREEQKVTRDIKAAAKKGDKSVCLILAKSMVQSRKAVAKLNVSKAQINSVIMCMEEQLAAIRMAGAIQQSTQVMRSMQSLIKVPEIMGTMRELSKEMVKLGIMEEMVEETFEAMEPEELEEQAQVEVERVLWEVTEGELGRAPAAPSTVDDSADRAAAQAVLDSVQHRLAQLKE